MPIYSTAVLTRTRVLLNPADVPAITTALVTGMPIPVPFASTNKAEPTHTACKLIYEQWVLRDYARFPLLDNDHAVADKDVMAAAFISSGGTDVYLDFTTLAYDGADTHASAMVWRASPGADFRTNDALHFGRGFTERAFFTSTKTDPGVRDVPRGELPPVADAPHAAHALFDPGFVSGPMRVPYAAIGDVADINTVYGPDIDDRVWDEPMPRFGTDLAFDALHPGAIIAQYRLDHRG